MKARLFILGDSFTFNLFNIEKLSKWHFVWSTYIEKHNQLYGQTPLHWSEYLENEFEVHNFSCPGQSNESIVYQLGNLPEFQHGDRLIIVFSDLGRFRRTSSTETSVPRPADYLINYPYDEQTDVIEQIINERFISLDTKNRDDEKRFYAWLKRQLHEYKPVFMHWPEWNEEYRKFGIINQMHHKSMWQETGEQVEDLHPGTYSNFLIYQQVCELLEIKASGVYTNKLKNNL
jgi:hypothetical protein